MKPRFSILLVFSIIFFNNVRANDTLIYFARSVALPGSSWKYLDNNTDLPGVSGTDFSWTDSNYVETAAWKTGVSELGYGDGDENTCVAWSTATVFPCNSPGGGAKYITTYFRKTFFISNISNYFGFELQYKRDDGIRIFVNGVQVEMNNISASPVLHSTLASNASDDGESVFSVQVPTSYFYGNGKRNVIAVDLHQSSATSSDLSFDLQLIGNTIPLIRGPYLQMGNQTGITVKWRTAVPTNSRVAWGTAVNSYPNIVDSSALTTEHEVRLSGLASDTKYFYSFGSSAEMYQAGVDNYFSTLPVSGSTRKTRVIAFGDCGNASTNQLNTKNAFLNYNGTNTVDAWILLGDNAYSSGTDAEYQAEFFDIYKNDLLKNIKLYPAPGNHDYGNNSANTAVRNNAYYNNFIIPKNAECGGVASGTEAYYSFNVGNIHFVSLDSYGRENANTTKLYDTSGAQTTWLKADLAANTLPFTVVYFHHPPYTMTSHNSDTELSDLGRVREEFVRILERFGVDMVLCGHSHGYERSYLLKNYYKQTTTGPVLLEADFNMLTHTATGNNQNARYDGSANSCPYTYNTGKYNHGTMYVVSGSAGQLGGSQTNYPHNAMYYSDVANGGSFLIESDSNRLDAKFLSYTGTGAAVTAVVRDQFSIFKNVRNRTALTVVQNVPTVLTASWRGGYYWPANAGATTQSVMIANATLGTFQYIVRDSASNTCLADTFDVTVIFALPVSVTNYTASLVNNKVQLKWTASYDAGVRQYQIEKSTDGIHFDVLGNLDAAAGNSGSFDYRLTDENPAEGVNYYRLTLLHTDGLVKYYAVRKVVAPGKASVSIVNAGKNKVKIVVNSSGNERIQFSVNDQLGRKILQWKTEAAQAVKELILPAGIYVLQMLHEAGGSKSIKMRVE